ncbi:hypothetical protein HW555_009348, partial [Spodoptera exigua]
YIINIRSIMCNCDICLNGFMWVIHEFCGFGFFDLWLTSRNPYAGFTVSNKQKQGRFKNNNNNRNHGSTSKLPLQKRTSSKMQIVPFVGRVGNHFEEIKYKLQRGPMGIGRVVGSSRQREIIEICISAFFSAPIEENIEQSNSEFNQELQQQVGRGIKQDIITNENKVTKKAKLDEGASTSSIETNDVNNNKVECDTCHVYIAKRYLNNHLKSNTHKNNLLKLHNSLPNVTVVETAFGNQILTYRINSKTHQSGQYFETPESFLNPLKIDILFLINECIQQHTILKINFILYADFIQQTKNIKNTFDFQTFNYIINA